MLCPVRSAIMTMSGAATSVGSAARRRANSSGTPCLRRSVSRPLRAAAAASGGRVRQRGVECGLDCRYPLAVVREDRGEPLRKFDIAQKPNQAIEQQILNRAIKLKLQVSGNLGVERVDV